MPRSRMAPLAAVLLVAAWCGTAGAGTPPGLRIERSGRRAVISVPVEVGALRIEADRAVLPGWGLGDGGDGPPLPVAEVLLPGDGWTVERTETAGVASIAGVDLAPLEGRSTASPPGIPPEAWRSWLRSRLAAVWRTASRAPWRAARTDGTVCRGGRCLTRIRLEPVHWDPEGRRLEVATALTVNLVRHRTAAAATPTALAPPQPPYSGADPAFTPHAFTVHRREGIVHLEWADLASLLGWDTATLDPGRIQVWEDGTQVAIDVAPGQWVELFVRPRTGEDVTGEFRHGDWTDQRVYWFIAGDGSVASMRVTARTVTPAGATPLAEFPASLRLRDEDDCHVISAAVPSVDDEIFHWRSLAWSSFYSPPEYVADLRLDLPGLKADSSTPVEFGVRLLGAASLDGLSPQHRQRFWLQDAGGAQIVEISGDPAFDFDGDTHHDDVFSLDAAEVAASDGVLYATSTDPHGRCTGTCPTFLWDIAQVDWVDVTYPRAPVAVDGACTITPGAPGTVRFQISGFAETAAAGLRLWDVTDPSAPVRLEGWTYATGTLDFQDTAETSSRYLAAGSSAWIRPTSGDLRPATVHDWAGGPAGGADWIAVGPRELVGSPALDRLAAERRSQGLRTAQVPVEEIYDEFSFGVPTPWAVRSFVAWAAGHWQAPAPSRLLLVGDASFDTKNQARPCSANCTDSDPSNDVFGPAPFPGAAMPTWVEVVPGDASGFGLLASDSWFGRVDGDAAPDVAVGRLPGRDAATLQVMVDRILAAEAAVPEADPWTTRFEYVAGARDGAALEPVLENARAGLPQAFDAATLYFAEPPWNGATADADGNGLSDMVDAMNAGRAVVDWLGHSGFQYLEAYPGGSALAVEDVQPPAALQGETGLLTAGACYMGAFDHATSQPTLGEALLAGGDGGAAAVMAHAAASYVYAADELISGIQDTLTGLDRSLAVGDALAEAQWRTLTAGHDVEAASLVLLGDPAMELPLPNPTAPASLWLRDQSCSRIRLGWSASPDAVTYTLHRSVDGGPYTELLRGIAGTSAQDGLAPPGHQVAYRVTAVDAAGFESAGSPPVLVTTPPGPGAQGDIDCSCTLDAADLAAWIVHRFAVPPEDPCGTADVNGDTRVDQRDLAALPALLF